MQEKHVQESSQDSNRFAGSKGKISLATARNLPGVDVVAAKDLNAEDLAPGGDVGV